MTPILPPVAPIEDGPTVAGVELGGTKSVLVLAAGSRVIAEQVVVTTTPHETLSAAQAQLSAWAQKPGFEALGIGAFGPLQLDPSSPDFGKLFTTPKPGWAGIDVAGELTRGLDCLWGIDTDVNAAALSELRWGAGRGCEDLCYITVGTGIGGGLVLSGQPVHGRMHPEIGHLRLRRSPNDQFVGACPFHGDCAEGLASGAALWERFGRNPAEVADNDPQWEHVAAALAEVAAAVILTSSVRRVLFGGTVIMSRSFLLQAIRRRMLASLANYLPAVHDSSIGDIVRRAELGTLAGPLGAVAVGLRALEGSSRAI